MLGIFVFIFSAMAFAGESLPPEATKYLEKLPNRSLTVDFILSQGIANSTAFELLRLEAAKAKLEVPKEELSRDWLLSGSGSFADNAFATTSPFQPTRTQTQNWNLGLGKNWTSGTRTQISWDHTWSDLQYNLPVGFGGGGATGAATGFLDDYRQTVATLTIEQNLLRDAFGKAQRDSLAGAASAEASLSLKVQSQVETTTLQFVGIFYQAWFKQKSVESLKAQQKRLRRLRRVTRQKLNRGSVEVPELIQVEALVASNTADVLSAEADLIQTWEEMVVQLDLPQALSGIDPLLVPTKLDSPMTKSGQMCQSGEAPSTNKDIESLEKSLLAVSQRLAAARSMGAPDLKLRGQYQGNGIDGRSAVTYNDIFRGTGPGWSVGLFLDWPLSNRATRVQQAELKIQKMTMESNLESLKDQIRTQWAEGCRRLELARKTETQYLEIVKKQKRRVKAEATRFAYGRIPLDQLITAETDLGQWELKTYAQSIDVRNRAWKILQMSGALYDNLEPLLEKGPHETLN